MVRLIKLLAGVFGVLALVWTFPSPASAACPGRQTSCGLLGAVSGSGSERAGEYELRGTFLGLGTGGETGEENNLPLRLDFLAVGTYELSRGVLSIGNGRVTLSSSEDVLYAFSITVLRSPAGWLILPDRNYMSRSMEVGEGSYLGLTAAGRFDGTLSFQQARP